MGNANARRKKKETGENKRRCNSSPDLQTGSDGMAANPNDRSLTDASKSSKKEKKTKPTPPKNLKGEPKNSNPTPQEVQGQTSVIETPNTPSKPIPAPRIQLPAPPPPPPPRPVLPSVKVLKQMRALFNFDKQVDDDMSFKKDDILELIDNSDEFWWKMRNPETGETGFVPYNYVQPFDGGPTSMAAWFDIDRREAERHLLMPGLPKGTYIIRPCTQKDQAAYSLSIRYEKEAEGEGSEVVLKHYMIKPTESGGFYISPSKVFESMQSLVENYQKSMDGLCAILTVPCPREFVPPPFRDFEINRKQLTMMEKLGNGSFGEVWKAKNGRLVEVAVKMMITNGQGLSMDKMEFVREAEIMHKLHHPKIVQLLGVCTTQEPFYIVTELMPNGALLSYLRNDNKNGRTITFNNMLDMLHQISDGMAYLEEKRFIHRDLRAANILVGKENLVKVADFGLSRLIEDDVYGVGEETKFPIRWTAPEAATEKVFTTKSDVWSFGILIYEIVTRGQTPYPEFKVNREILAKVSQGHRMANPKNPDLGIMCEDYLYNSVMMACWNASPVERPTFAALRNIFESYDVEKQQQYG